MIYLLKSVTSWYNHYKGIVFLVILSVIQTQWLLLLGDMLGKMKKTKDKSPLAILQSLLITSIFLPERTTRNSLSTTLFITAYNLALVCCNCTFETHLKKEKLRKGPRSFIFPTVTCFISSFLIGSYQPASIRFLLSSLSTKNTYKCLSQ